MSWPIVLYLQLGFFFGSDTDGIVCRYDDCHNVHMIHAYSNCPLSDSTIKWAPADTCPYIFQPKLDIPQPDDEKSKALKRLIPLKYPTLHLIQSQIMTHGMARLSETGQWHKGYPR